METKAYLVGGGIASLAAAAFLIRTATFRERAFSYLRKPG
jgi:myosin-crossreactive antigen